ncbi:DUF3037 domain-containing protein [Halopseudomonas bauzanensis]|uniref:DUF3037 domain-containing protein n=1 Tax=Halopseudomonas bauzanensis TaxID=653930 RepID=UPI0025527172|nr:DUF3037 domain-containing protein [Halopseudomonas bauzanensis]
MNIFCNYSILRFLPYLETGEFVNIGVVLFASNGDFRFKIASKRQRVTRFFDKLDAKIYISARNEIDEELARLSTFFVKHRENQSIQLATFKHLIQPRETMMRFSDPGTIAAGNTQSALDQLFEHYVNHSFASKEYEEKILERQLGNLLASANIKQRYKEEKLGNTDYSVKFPFVLLHQDRAVQALKPLHLAHDEPGKILEHGDAWVARVKRLQRAKKLAQDTLFIASAPPAGHHKLTRAYEDIVAHLEEIETVRVIKKDLPDQKILGAIEEGLPQTSH